MGRALVLAWAAGLAWVGNTAAGNCSGGADGPGLLVVAPAGLAASLGEFVAFKGARLPTSLVTLEDALAAGEGADDPERLKRYLFERWREGGIRYVLLVGDADVMPVRYMVLDRNTEAAFNYAFYPSDLYYADVAKPDGSFESWNAQYVGFHAAYFGEVRGEHFKSDPINYDRVDYRPELALGRWPVSTPEGVALVAGKTMRYERGVEQAGKHAAVDGADGGTAWPARAGLAMVGGWVDARGEFEQLRRTLEGRFAVERRYYDGKSYGVAEPSAAEIVGLLNSGVGLLIHAGHGSDNTWHECIGTANLPEMHNADHLAVMISAGCSTARFATLPPYEPYEDVDGKEHAGSDHGEVFSEPPPAPACYARGAHNMTGLGEQLVVGSENGAVAYIGCNTGSQPCAMTLVEGFVDGAAGLGSAGLGSEGASVRLGDCWAHAESYYFDHAGLATIVPDDGWYPASIFFQGMKYMLFGDPSIPVGSVGAGGP
ncbi:MAG: hypothetical protein IPJ41_06585 [Phycisphaerales bacterium]|nr:hypothetical protein [Phycisphaerales bacterium]